MYWITLDCDGTEVFKEPRRRRHVPRNGFIKGKDGNFYKKLGDPRCITFLEARKRVLELKEQQEQKKRRSEQIEKDREAITGTQTSPAFSETKTKMLKVNNRFKIDEITKKTVFDRCLKHYSTATEKTAYYRARLIPYFGIIELDKVTTFAKVEVLPESNIMKFWLTNTIGNPDYVLIGVFETDKEGKEDADAYTCE